ncbi:MAG: protein kinase [Oscillatoria sp. SIO1A7]|nr:protein kinase [Oscillatoria sp. SIO1A7]
MKNYPNFEKKGYKILRELGRNREGGRVTYLASALESEQQVVIKEFRFARVESSWTGWKAWEREIEVLGQLSHPRIPKYLNSFETSEGFCLVQDYKNAPALAQVRGFSPEEIRQIVLSVLEILAYLQSRTPPIVHRDLKPENILVEDRGFGQNVGKQAYLVDFGLARIKGGEVAVESLAAGTPGFMPPEEIFNRSLSAKSDLYSLGATTICLLAGIPSVEIGNFIDDDYRFNLQGLGELHPRFVAWLGKMVAPNPKDRYANAKKAIAALEAIPSVTRQRWQSKMRDIFQKKSAILRQLIAFGFVAATGAMAIAFWLNRPSGQLLSKRKCPRCNLENVNLEGANLGGVNLQEANLQGAKLAEAKLWGANLKGANLKQSELNSANLENADLREVALADASLIDANLEGADLEGAELLRVNLDSANLEDATLSRVSLLGARFHRANLRGSNLYEANLEGANLENTNLAGASLENTELKNAKLNGVDLQSVQMKGADLENANLERATLSQLQDANLKGANLQNANLQDADLWKANLENANLEGANLANANLAGANLVGANLDNANLEGANLKGAKLEGASFGDDS